MASNPLSHVFTEVIAPMEVRAPRFLYHYTTAGGLEGILSSGAIFMSDAMFLNDHSEVLYGKGLIATTLRESSAIEDDDKWRRILELAAYMIAAPETAERIFRFFVASFCVNGNQLSQWRAYGLPGSGFAIGFATTKLKTISVQLNERLKVALRRVEYRRERQIALVNRAIATCKREAMEVPRLDDNATVTNLAIGVTMALSLFLPQFKHPMFAEEREWRTVVLTVDTQAQPYLSFRQSHGRIVPYLAVDCRVQGRRKSTLPVARVVHAPGPEPHLTKRSVHDLLVMRGYNSVSIIGSDIPLRVS